MSRLCHVSTCWVFSLTGRSLPCNNWSYDSLVRSVVCHRVSDNSCCSSSLSSIRFPSPHTKTTCTGHGHVGRLSSLNNTCIMSLSSDVRVWFLTRIDNYNYYGVCMISRFFSECCVYNSKNLSSRLKNSYRFQWTLLCLSFQQTLKNTIIFHFDTTSKSTHLFQTYESWNTVVVFPLLIRKNNRKGLCPIFFICTPTFRQSSVCSFILLK